MLVRQLARQRVVVCPAFRPFAVAPSDSTRPLKWSHCDAGMADEIDDLLAKRTAAAQPSPPLLMFGLSPSALSRVVAALLAAVLLIWVGVSNLVENSSQLGLEADVAPSLAAAPATAAAADLLPWMRRRPDHLALNERWGLPKGLGPQPPAEVVGHRIPRILHHSERAQLAGQRCRSDSRTDVMRPCTMGSACSLSRPSPRNA